ncbi:transporter [Leifsonia bigeumensis]|uniref:Transporter n=1 Tax=Leifsonella bigeumensis TaxID=433643 RepID=A0ABP7FQC2_9MICO
MDRLLPSIIVGFVIVAALIGMFFGWRARQRRQAGIPAPEAVPADVGAIRTAVSGLYVATTRAGEPLERIAVRGLGYRSRMVATVADRGVTLELTGARPAFIPATALRSAGRATWAIDKAVEPGGLVVLGWRLGDLDVDSYFRIDGEAQAFIDAAAGITA